MATFFSRYKRSWSQWADWTAKHPRLVALAEFPFGRRSWFCRSCGRPLISATEFCEACLTVFDSPRRRGMRLRVHPLLNKIQVRSLWSWYPNADGPLSGLLPGLKGPRHGTVWRELARRHLEAHARDLTQSGARFVGVIPVASKSGGPDHAELFARALAELLGVPCVEALQAVSLETKTRDLNRGERLRRRPQMRALDAWKTQPAHAGRWILVDDILTTGATSRDALAVLGPLEAELWVLAVRERGWE